MTLIPPEKIRTLQRKLYTKARQEPGYRFYALYDKLCRTDILDHAYRLVRSNRGASGMDGRTFEAIEAGEGQEAFVRKLQEQMESKTYQADAVRRVCIPKPDDGALEIGACLGVKNIGKPCTGKPYARFDEGEQAFLIMHRREAPPDERGGNR